MQKRTHAHTSPNHIIPLAYVPERLRAQDSIDSIDMPQIGERHCSEIPARDRAACGPAAHECKQSKQQVDVAELVDKDLGLLGKRSRR